MAEKRMFSKQIVDSDAFLQLPVKAQLLYFHLGLRADDEGFVVNSRTMLRVLGFRKLDLNPLLEQNLLLQFPDGVLLISHWKVHNKLRQDRMKATTCVQHLDKIYTDENGIYHMIDPEKPANKPKNGPAMSDKCPADVRQMPAQYSTDKNSIDKYRSEEDSKNTPPEESGVLWPVTDFEKSILHSYQTFCPSLKKCNKLTVATRRNLIDLVAKGWDPQRLDAGFKQAEQCDFLKGGGPNGWVASLDWLIAGDHMQLLEEGKYDTWTRPIEAANTFGSGELGQAELDAIRKLLASE